MDKPPIKIKHPSAVSCLAQYTGIQVTTSNTEQANQRLKVLRFLFQQRHNRRRKMKLQTNIENKVYQSIDQPTQMSMNEIDRRAYPCCAGTCRRINGKGKILQSSSFQVKFGLSTKNRTSGSHHQPQSAVARREGFLAG